MHLLYELCWERKGERESTYIHIYLLVYLQVKKSDHTAKLTGIVKESIAHITQCPVCICNQSDVTLAVIFQKQISHIFSLDDHKISSKQTL